VIALGRALLILAFLVSGPLGQAVEAAECGSKFLCADMADCAEATFYLSECGLERLDGDNDGIPCETLCGKTKETFQLRLNSPSASGLMGPVYSCGEKQTCAEMVSCSEARFYLSECGRKRLDADGDGIPCKGLCR
jgi:hypothetical protein